MMSLARNIRVGQDLDGVWYNFDNAFTRYLLSTGYDASKIAEVTRWEFYKDFGLTTPEFLDYCHKGVDAGVIFSTGNPYDGALESANRITSAGCEIHVVTDRTFGKPNASLNATTSWLAMNKFPVTSVTISADKTVVDVDYFLEDKLENYDALDAAGVKSYLINRPWNSIEGGDNRRRIDKHEEFTNIVLSAAS